MTDDSTPRGRVPEPGDEAADRRRRDTVGEAIVAGYGLIPQEGDDLERADAATAAVIAEEPW